MEFMSQIKVLHMKNTLNLLRDKRRLALMILYPVYFVLLLGMMKASSVPTDYREWVDQAPQPLIWPPLGGNVRSYRNTSANVIVYSCKQNCCDVDCNAIMRRVASITGSSVVMSASPNAYWRSHKSSVVAGVEFSRINGLKAAYTVRLASDDLRESLWYGTDTSVEVELSKPLDSLSTRAYVWSGFASLQFSVNRAIAEVVAGIETGLTAPLVAPFPTIRFQTYYSSDKSLIYLIPFYMVIAFCNVVVYVVVAVVMEKQNHLLEYFRMHGMTLWAYWMSWILTIGLVGSLSCGLCAILLTVTHLLPKSDVSLVFLLLLLYNIAGVPVAFVVSTLIKDQRVAGMVGGIGSILLGAPTLFLSSITHPAVKNALGLIPPLAMAEALSVVLDFEVGGEGLKWANIAETRRGFSFLNGLLFLLFDIVFYFLLALYLYEVMPNQGNGATKHPLFCCMQKETQWSIIESDMATEPPTVADAQEPARGCSSLFEDLTPELSSMTTDEKVSIQELSKTYTSSSGDRVTALERLSFEMFSGEIFSLLGVNGAGKTTALSLLTGSVQPSSGSASVLGFDMRSEMDHIRSFTGYCPQQDTLYLQLTCLENLKIFAGLKGKPVDDAVSLLGKLGVGDKRDEVVDKLSGGMKRALSIAVSLVGNPTLLILDEPTSGMDPASRRKAWDVILEGKKDRVTLLTTHFLDEADVLSDRVAIMSRGQLQCMGSPLFLKNNLGVGYHLSLLPARLSCPGVTFDRDAVISFVQSRVPCAQLESRAELSENSGGEVVWTIPTEATIKLTPTSPSAMSSLLLDLDGSLEELCLETYGITLTTLEEVFLKINAGLGGDENDDPSTVLSARAFEITPPRATFLKQFVTVLKTRLILARRAWRYNLGSSFMPALFVLVSLILQTFLDAEASPKTVNTSSSVIKDKGQLWWGTHDPVHAIFPPCLFNATGGFALQHALFQGHSEQSLQRGILEQARYGKSELSPQAAIYLGNDSTCIGSNFNGSWTLHFNQSHVNSLPGHLSYMAGAVLLGDVDAFDLTAATFESREDSFTLEDVGIALTLTYLIGLEFASFTTTFAYDAAVDRKEGRLHQLKVSGVHTFAVWGSLALIDITRWCLPFVGIFSLLGAWGSEMLIGHGAGGALALAMLFVGLQTVFMGYSLGQCISDPTFVTTSLGTISYLATMVLFMITYTLLVGEVGFPVEVWPAACGLIVFGGIFLPAFLIMCSFSAVMHMSAFGSQFPISSGDYLTWKTECTYVEENICPGVFPVILSVSLSTTLSILYLCGFHTRIIRMLYVWNFLNLEIRASVNSERETGAVSPDVEVESEKDWVERARNDMTRSVCNRGRFASEFGIEMGQQHTFQPIVTAHNSSSASQVVVESIDPESSREDMVLIHKLQKEFPSPSRHNPPGMKVAVGGVSLGINRGEIFGLLGHNGAGKTTLIGMLTGSIESTSGDAFVDGRSVWHNRHDVLSSTGFCPQSGGTWPDLTLREHLEMFALLRGFGEDDESGGSVSGNSHATGGGGSDDDGVVTARVPIMKELLDEVETSLGLAEHSSKRVKELSGGTRRKLSAAIALLGCPRVVYLDEPSTGVDASSRIKVWAMIRGSGRENPQQPQVGISQTTSPSLSSPTLDRAILLTTHSMVEADALSNRLGIMVGGSLRALGSPQVLKSRYGSEYQLDVKLRTHSEAQVSGGEATDVGNNAAEIDNPLHIQALQAPPRSSPFVQSTGAAEPIHIRTQSATDVAIDVAREVGRFVCSAIPGAVLAEHHASTMHFLVPADILKTSALSASAPSMSGTDGTGHLGLGFVFNLVESNAERLGIAAFSLSQTTLEQVFLRVAKEDSEE